MFNTLYFLYLNNYYDRIETVDWELGLYLENVIQTSSGINFNPNDGVNTELIINMNDIETPNYLVVCDESNNIKSKWYIIDSNRIRGGQYKYTLHRDVISDYWNVIKQSPCLIEKCSLNYDDPLIFNNEDMTFNQIKTSETLLKDKSNCAWLVGYLAKEETYEGSIAYNSANDLDVLPAESWSQFMSYSSLMESPETLYGNYNSLKYQVYFQPGASYAGHVDIDWKNANNSQFVLDKNDNGSSLTINSNTISRDFLQAAINNGFSSNMSELNLLAPAYTPDRNTDDVVFDLYELNGRYVQDELGRVYRATIVQMDKLKTEEYDVTAGSLYNLLATSVAASIYKGNPAFLNKPNNKSFKLKATYIGYQIYLERIEALETSYNLSASAHVITADAPYDIIAIPYGEVAVGGTGLTNPIITNADLGLRTIISISRQYTAAKAYDIQLVPYCPIPDLITDKGEITVTSTSQYSKIVAGENPVGIIFHVPNASFTANIDHSIAAAATNIQRKINNECDKWRLCSPNYSNYFDFSVEKNGGVNYFNVDCTYKPFSPYIHINPNFKGMYGSDFNDPRGLVCGGDFSLAQLTDNWQAYQIQNKNFQASFDRQIQNMEINNKYQKVTDITSAISGSFQGAASAALISGGNPYAAIAGGVVSGAAGAADIIINEKLRNKALDYTRNMFAYNLGNIQALPLTLSKISAFNANNKIFPVLEYYTATDREKEALANKVAYNGMTTMVIGTIEENTGNNWEITINNHTITSKNYIKAKPIRLNLNDDFHVANAIAKELNMGFYIDEEE